MPSFKIAGKSKEDLAVVAQLAGLVSPEDAAQLSRPDLVLILEKENRKTAKIQAIRKKADADLAAAPAAVEPAPRTSRAARPRKPAAMSQTSALAETPETETSETAPAVMAKPERKPRTAKSHKPAETKILPPADDAAAAAPALDKPITRKKAGAAKPAAAPAGPEASLGVPTAPAADAAAQAPEEQIPRNGLDADNAVGIAVGAAKIRPAAKSRKMTPAAKTADAKRPSAAGIEPAIAEPVPAVAPMAAAAETGVQQLTFAEASVKTESEAAAEPAPKTAVELEKPVHRAASRRRKAGAAAAVSPEPTGAEVQIELPPAEEAPIPESAGDQPEAADIPEMQADQSPEGAEAAADKDQAGDPAEQRHVPPHHTLSPVHAGKRRTIRTIGGPETDTDYSETVGRPTGRPDQRGSHSRVPNSPGRPAAAPAAYGGQTGPTERNYPAAGPQAPSILEDDKNYSGLAPSSAAPATVSENAGTVATIIPITPGTETETAKGHRPVVETGDVQAGVLEIMPDGYGFLRKENYLQGNKDIYVPPQYIRRFGLRPGDFISGPVKLQRENDRYQALLYIKDVNGQSPEKMLRRSHFDRLTPIYPDERFVLETARNELSTRIIDLVAPIGKGQRGMIVSPPKAGKTILLQKIANAISINNPDVKLIVLLIDERPEEVTDMQRSINGEVVYSTFDKTPENHTKVTELVLERAMRLVELKQDVVILLDSMTRLARAYNLSISPTGRTLSGGLDPGALYGPKRFFGAARNIENGGSLTIIATSLIETGSRMDEVIFEEFKGTGNMEVYLDRKMSEKRIFPAIDINKSGTRREELLMTTKELDAVWTIRKAFSQLDTTSVTEAIINLLLKTKSNEHFISSVNVSFNDKNVFEAMRGTRSPETGQNSAGSTSGRGAGYGGYNNSGMSSNYRRQTSNDDD